MSSLLIELFGSKIKTVKILVISDIHGNPLALNAVLEKYGDSDQVWATGDYIGFCPHPDKVIEILKKIPHLVAVKGNWEHLYLTNFDVTSIEKTPGNATKEEVVTVITDGMKRVTESVKDFISTLPDTKEILINDKKFHLAHCAAYDPFDGSLDTKDGFEKSIEASDADVFINGDIHLQKNTTYKNRLFLNPGAVSWPSDNKDMGAHCMILTLDKGLSVTFDRVPYDYKAIYKDLVDINLPRADHFLQSKSLWE